jgi:hypothetical protein
MGTWASPRTEQSALELVKFMANPIDYRDIKKLYEILGDDVLWDCIHADKGTDVRPIIAAALGNWMREDLPNWFKRWRTPWEPKAIEIVLKEIFTYGEYPVKDQTELFPLFLD